MSRLVCALACFIVLQGTMGGLDEVAAAAPVGDVVVVTSSSSSNVAANLVPVVGESCAPTLRDLRKAGFKIIDAQGGGTGILYTLEKEGHKDAVVIVACAPLVEATPLPPRDPS
jgi:hypothetical protein